MSKKVEKLIILGSGPAGLTAAIYAARGGLDPLIISGERPGGQPTWATEIEDYPGFPKGVKGPELVSLFKKQAEKFNTRFINGQAVKVNFHSSPFEINTEGSKLAARAVVLAVGATPLWLGLPSEQRLIGRGVGVCAVCDGPFFKKKKVAVVGGGDAAMKEAYFLSKLAESVTIIHRRDTLRAQEVLQKQVKKRPNIKFLYNSVVKEVLGQDRVDGLRVQNTQNDKIRTLKIDGAFIAIGHKPDTDFLRGQVDLDEKGYIKIFDETRTSVPGVFAAGDAVDHQYRQIVTAAGSGCKAAIDAVEYLDNIGC